MAKRCGCSDSCSCLIVAGTGVTVEGIGTLEQPYEINANETAELLGRLEFSNDGNVEFDTEGVGTLTDPYTVSANAQLRMVDLIDVNDPDGDPADGEVPVWVGSHWEFRPQTGGGGGSLPPGGTTGQVLAKLSNVDGDAAWVSTAAGSTDEVLVATALPPTPGGLELWVDTDDNALISGSQLIQSGITNITPSAANVPVAKAVVFPVPFGGVPNVVISSNSMSPGTSVLGVAAQGASATGFNAYLTRDNLTTTTCTWIAVGTVA